MAKTAFVKGQTLFSESPIVSAQFAWNKVYKYRACDNCMRPLETSIENIRRLADNQSLSLPYMAQCCPTSKQNHCKCDQCGIEYCSEKCRFQAIGLFHQTLCQGSKRDDPNSRFNLLMDFWRQIHLPPETTSIELIVKLIAIIKQVRC